RFDGAPGRYRSRYCTNVDGAPGRYRSQYCTNVDGAPGRYRSQYCTNVAWFDLDRFAIRCAASCKFAVGIIDQAHWESNAQIAEATANRQPESTDKVFEKDER